jgi:hypothetical protein
MTHTGPAVARRTRAPKWPLLIGLLVTALLIAAVLIGRAALRSHYEESRRYADAAAIPAHNGLFVLPPWAPRDAKDIRINVQTQGKGISLTFTTAAPGLAAPCAPTPAPKRGPVPDLRMSDGVRHAAGHRCEQWFVARAGSTVWAWTPYDD